MSARKDMDHEDTLTEHIEMVKQVIDANLKLGFDFEEMARRMTDSLLG